MAQNADQQPPSLVARVAAARATAMQTAAEAEAQRSQAYADAFEHASDRLRTLITAELDIVDMPGPINFHKEYSHGSPEADYAVVKMEPYWLAIRLLANGAAVDQESLLGLIHCPNGHVLGLEYPTNEDDSWDRALLRLDEAQRLYASGDNCPNCVTLRSTVRPYRPPV